MIRKKLMDFLVDLKLKYKFELKKLENLNREHRDFIEWATDYRELMKATNEVYSNGIPYTIREDFPCPNSLQRLWKKELEQAEKSIERMKRKIDERKKHLKINEESIKEYRGYIQSIKEIEDLLL